ncbi:MAG: hypothetical protein WBO08_18695 [Mycobacterium sp.]
MTEPADLDVSQPTTANVQAAQTLSRNFDRLARDLESVTGRFGGDNGLVVRGAREEFTLVRNAFDAEAMAFAQLAVALTDLRAAGDRWLRNAPKAADLEAGQAAVDAARAVMQAAANADQPTAALVEQLKTAEQRLRDLRARRKAADEAYESACERAGAKLPRGLGKCKPGESGERDYNGDGKGATQPSPGRTPPPTRIAATPPAAAPAPLTPSAPAMPTVSANFAAPAPVAPSMQMPHMPQVPATSAAPAAPAARRDDRDRTTPTIETPDLAGLLAAGTAPAATTPRPAAPAAAPVAAPALVAPNPGFSANNLSTVADVLGRPTPTPGAFAAPTGLSAGHAVQQVHGGPGTETGTRTGAAPMGGPMMPGMGGMPGGGSGGSTRDRDQLVRSYSPLGMESLTEAVPGGTIAQRRDKKVS